MTNITVCTTFPSTSWNVYSKAMLQSFVANWPADVPLLIELDDDLILDGVRSQARECDAVAAGWLSDHAAFVARNKDKEDPQNYRKQAVRFCHKVFTLHRAMQAVQEQPAPKPRYLIWMDGDVVTNRKITHEDLALCLPKDGDAVSYLGRKDWPHSECGWLAFDLENGGGDVIKAMHTQYVTDGIFQFKQWDDSWVFDEIRKVGLQKFTNLTDGKPGMEIWPHSPMGKWSTHYKGPVAKQKLGNAQPRPPHPNPTGKVIINTRNALPNETLQAHISRNQELIKNWISFCKPTDEQIVMVSAGPQLIAEEVRAETGKKIVAVKHALTPLKKAGITPWACILLDPRPHVADFIKDADPAVLWFVASQVNPEVTIQLLAKGCTVWGYHAAVNAGEEHLTAKQPGAVVSGGSATSTRGMFMLHHLGFSNFKLYGYDLSIPDKPNLDEKDEQGQPKYFEMSVGMNDPMYNLKKMFWSEPQLIAQFEEINDLVKSEKFELEAVGDGIVPFMIKAKKVADLRRSELKAKITGDNPPTCMELINGTPAPASRPAAH